MALGSLHIAGKDPPNKVQPGEDKGFLLRIDKATRELIDADYFGGQISRIALVDSMPGDYWQVCYDRLDLPRDLIDTTYNLGGHVLGEGPFGQLSVINESKLHSLGMNKDELVSKMVNTYSSNDDLIVMQIHGCDNPAISRIGELLFITNMREPESESSFGFDAEPLRLLVSIRGISFDCPFGIGNAGPLRVPESSLNKYSRTRARFVKAQDRIPYYQPIFLWQTAPKNSLLFDSIELLSYSASMVTTQSILDKTPSHRKVTATFTYLTVIDLRVLERHLGGYKWSYRDNYYTNTIMFDKGTLQSEQESDSRNNALGRDFKLEYPFLIFRGEVLNLVLQDDTKGAAEITKLKLTGCQDRQ